MIYIFNFGPVLNFEHVWLNFHPYGSYILKKKKRFDTSNPFLGSFFFFVHLFYVLCLAVSFVKNCPTLVIFATVTFAPLLLLLALSLNLNYFNHFVR